MSYDTIPAVFFLPGLFRAIFKPTQRVAPTLGPSHSLKVHPGPVGAVSFKACPPVHMAGPSFGWGGAALCGRAKMKNVRLPGLGEQPGCPTRTDVPGTRNEELELELRSARSTRGCVVVHLDLRVPRPTGACEF